MFSVLATGSFLRWRARLKDVRAKEKLAQRIVRLQAGHFGDVKFFDGIGELRISHGPGYRIYFTKKGDKLIILLCGGDKGSQKRDINRAKELAKELRDGLKADEI